jgi:CDP-glucose 4,6-dehydratase
LSLDDLEKMNPDFWRGRRVFITGHTGFKGSWLALWLARMGAQVCGFALAPPTQPSLFAVAGVNEAIGQSVLGDIRDHGALEQALRSFDPDVVLHLAAQSVVLSSYADPIETFSVNVVGTASLLSAVRHLKRQCAVINVTTDKVYDNRQWVWGYRENDALGGRDPYSSSKACAELVARSFRDSYFSAKGTTSHVAIASARAGNVIGGGDWTPHQLVPETIAACEAGTPVVLRNPGAVRPWQHVLDCLSGYLVLAEALYRDSVRYSGEWNFGPSDADMQPVSHVVEVLSRPWRSNPAWVCDARSHPHEEMELRLNSQKASRELRWRPRLPLEVALEWTGEWFRRHRDGVAARELCEKQIESFELLLPGVATP